MEDAVRTNPEEGLDLLERAAALYRRDEVGANLLLRRAALGGRAEALFELSVRYARGVPLQDIDEAWLCLRHAYNMGSLRAARCINMVRPFRGDAGWMSRLAPALEAASKTRLDDHYGQLLELAGIDFPGPLDGSDMQILQDLAAVGCAFSASVLSVEYDAGTFSADGMPDHRASLRWELVAEFLEGNLGLVGKADPDGVDPGPVVEEVRQWIAMHPLARQAAFAKWYRDRYVESAGRMDPDGDLPDAISFPEG